MQVSGASYIEVSVALPPNDRMSNWLGAQGVLGLVWCGGKWFVSDAAAKFLGGGGSGVLPRSKLRRDMWSTSKGHCMRRRRIERFIRVL